MRPHFKPTNILLMMFCQQLTIYRIFKRLAKALIRMRVCAVWSESFLVAHTTLLEISCRGRQSSRSEISLNAICFRTIGLNSIKFHRNVSYNALYQICTKCYGPPNKGSWSPEFLRRNIFKRRLLLYHLSKLKIRFLKMKNSFTEMFLTMPSTKLAQTIQLGCWPTELKSNIFK